MITEKIGFTMNTLKFRSMLDEADSELSKLFRNSRKYHVAQRTGDILLVDDIPEQKGVLEAMLCALSIKDNVVNVSSVSEAENYVKINSDNIKIIVIDVLLSGGVSGLDFVNWLMKGNSDIPFVIITGSEEIVDSIKKRFPGVDVLVKGVTGINEFADAMGYPELKSHCGYDRLPIDSDA